MNTNDNLSKSEEQNTNIKKPHMFQNEDRSTTLGNLDNNNEMDSQVIMNMSKIAKRFKSDQTNGNYEKDNKSLVFSTNKLIDINLIDSTKPIYEYFDEVKNKKNHIEVTLDEVENTASIDVEDQVEEEEIPNIDDIIKDSEKLIFNSHDKRTLLRELIDDVSSNSVVNFTYDDQKFEENIKEILSEMSEEMENHDAIIIETDQLIVDSIQTIQKSKFKIYFIFTVILLISVTLYIYKDTILRIISRI